MNKKNKAKKAKKTQDLSGDFVRNTNDYFLAETMRVRADMALIFGTHDEELCTAMARTAATAYHDGMFQYIVVSGGPILNGTGLTEAEYITDILRKEGVASKHIIVENLATNTQGNVLRAQKQSGRLLSNIMRHKRTRPVLYCFANIHGGRRFLMTIKKNWPEVLPVIHYVPEAENFKNKWHKNVASAQKILAERQKLPDYMGKGWIEEVDISQINQELLALNREKNKTQNPKIQ
jgi:hypothetical protein